MKITVTEEFQQFSDLCKHRIELEGYDEKWKATRFLICSVNNLPCFDVDSCLRVEEVDSLK